MTNTAVLPSEADTATAKAADYKIRLLAVSKVLHEVLHDLLLELQGDWIAEHTGMRQ